jgi:hypothetical protein
MHEANHRCIIAAALPNPAAFESGHRRAASASLWSGVADRSHQEGLKLRTSRVIHVVSCHAEGEVGDVYVRLHGSEQTLTAGLVIDYTPKIQVGENGEFKQGRFCYAARRRHKITFSSGIDAGALYANWQFNQPQAVTLEDAYVNNNGILYGQPKFVDDEGHRSIVFHGNDQYAEAPRSVADFGQMTIDMLVKSAGLGGRLFDFGTSEKECYYLEIVQGKPTLVAHHAGKTYKLASSQAIAPKKWSRLRIEMDGASAAIHVDGKQTAKQSFPFRPFMVFPGDAPVGNFIACSRNRDEFFQGQMDHFRIYRKVHEDA